MAPNSTWRAKPMTWCHKDGFYFIFLTFYVGVYQINNAVIVSGEQGRGSAMRTHVSILPQTPLPSRLPHNIELNSMCYIIGACWLSILNIAVCT